MLNLEGSTQLDPDLGWPTRLKLRGDSIRAVQLPDADISASPDLDIVAELPDLHVNGTVHVPHADVKLSELPEQAVTPSSDTVVHGESETVWCDRCIGTATSRSRSATTCTTRA